MRVTLTVAVLRCAERARSCRLGLFERGSRAGRPTAAGFRKPFPSVFSIRLARWSTGLGVV